MLLNRGEWLSGRGQGNEKRAALARFGLDPNFAVLPFQDALGNGQTQAFALSFAWIEPVKNLEDFPLMLRRDADAVVPHRVDCPAVFHATGEVNVPAPFPVEILERIVEEVG